MASFRLTSVDSKSNARLSELKTGHGKVKGPFFMPVETKGAAKFVSQGELEKMGFECFISNALLLHFKPGIQAVQCAGGLHGFLSWPKSIFTDSGGFQVISEHFLESISDKGAVFRSPFDGKKEKITPEKAVEIQVFLGSDAAMCLDHQPPAGAGKTETAKAVARTARWAERCKSAHENQGQMLFGICQGGLFADLRIKSISSLKKIGFDGYAVGGFGIGESEERMLSVLKKIAPCLPPDSPRYLMGIGSPVQMLEAVALGFDCFDSCYPTRMGRHGMAMTKHGPIRIEKTLHSHSFIPIDGDCKCFVCKNYSRAYLHHLVRLREPSGMRYMSHHNLYFLSSLMKGARTAIKENRFAGFLRDFKKSYSHK